MDKVSSDVNFFRPPLLRCSEEEHYPFKIHSEIAKIPLNLNNEECNVTDAFIGTVKTSSWDFDGERTDLHDIWSLSWAIFFRSFGIASPYLESEENDFGCPGEIYARHIIMPISGASLNHEESIKSFKSWTALAFHILDDVFEWDSVFSRKSKFTWKPGIEILAPWLVPLLKEIGTSDYVNFISRRNPNWVYFSDFSQDISVLRLSRKRMSALKVICSGYSPNQVNVGNFICIMANNIPNAVPHDLVMKGLKYLSICEGSINNVQMIPIENACIFIGDKTLISLYGNCGLEQFHAVRSDQLKKREAEDSVFYTNASIKWKKNLNGKHFEDLAADLLSLEPGVISVKQVGATNDRDGGRDLLVERKLPSPSGSGAFIAKIIVQVKARNRSINKANVIDIRDTVENYNADGYLLLSYPRITSSLFDHLQRLKERQIIYVDWWIDRDWEERLRRFPNIAKKYPDLLSING